MSPMQRPHKYGARKVVVDGLTFDSAAEAKRWRDLKLLQRAGEIKELVCQPEYRLHGMGGGEVCKYRADFFYLTSKGERVVEDVKGYRKGPVYQLFRLKAKLFKDNFGFDITEIGKNVPARRAQPAKGAAE